MCIRDRNRGGRGIKVMQTIDDDYIEELLMTTTHHYLMFFTNTGRVYRLDVYKRQITGSVRGTLSRSARRRFASMDLR